MFLLACNKCGSPALARSSRATLCSSCRLVARLRYAKPNERRKCQVCSSAFMPSHSYDHKVCGACESHGRRTVATDQTACSLCKTTDHAHVYPDLAVCLACVKDPAQRDTIKKRLTGGQKNRTILFESRTACVEKLAELWDAMPTLTAAWEAESEADARMKRTIR